MTPKLRSVLNIALPLAIGATFVFNYVLYSTCGLRGCPEPDRLAAYQPGGASVMLDRNGKEFASLAPFERELIKLVDLPAYVAAAFVAVEDKRFYEHRGVDWTRVAGAALRNLGSGEIDQGSSTITMQLARNVFPDRLKASDKTLRRKLFEARVAKRIERQFTKREILELYVNHIYFGGGAYGIETAARYYFGKPASKLQLREAALLAAMPKAPTHYDPRTKVARAKARRDLVLTLMAEQGIVSAGDAAEARQRGLGVTANRPAQRGASIPGAYFVQMVRRELEAQLGNDIYTKQLRVYTTLDIEAQRAAETELARQLRDLEAGSLGRVNAQRYGDYKKWSADGPSYVQGAVVVLEVATGDILALVGGRDIRHSSFNRATLARRQAGSAFKPFVYGAAIADGYVPSQPILDSPVRLASNGRQWEPRNYDGGYYGMLSMRRALVQSRNIPSVRLAAAVGHRGIQQFARATGIRGNVQATPMVALGITEVTPLELTSAFGTFAGMGTRAEPRSVIAVVDEQGNVLYRTSVKTEARIDPAVAYIMTHMMEDVVNYGTAGAVRRAGFGGAVAGKTGTTSDGADVWFVGYTPHVVAGVWVGYDTRRPLPARANGGNVSAPVFGRIMRRLHQTRSVSSAFDVPDRVVWRRIDPASGLVLEAGCIPRDGISRSEVFLREVQPGTVCPRHESENFFELIGNFLGGLFNSRSRSDEPEPDVVSGSGSVLGAERIARREFRR